MRVKLWSILLIWSLPFAASAQSLDDFPLVSALLERKLAGQPEEPEMLGELAGVYWVIKNFKCEARDWPEDVDPKKAEEHLLEAFQENPQLLAYPIFIVTNSALAVMAAVPVLGCDSEPVQAIFTQSILALGEYNRREIEAGSLDIPLAQERSRKTQIAHYLNNDTLNRAYDAAGLAINYASDFKPFLNCSYGPMNSQTNRGFAAFKFWNGKIFAFSPEELGMLGQKSDFVGMSLAVIDECPQTYSAAERLLAENDRVCANCEFDSKIIKVAERRMARFKEEYQKRKEGQ